MVHRAYVLNAYCSRHQSNAELQTLQTCCAYRMYESLTVICCPTSYFHVITCGGVAAMHCEVECKRTLRLLLLLGTSFALDYHNDYTLFARPSCNHSVIASVSYFTCSLKYLALDRPTGVLMCVRVLFFFFLPVVCTKRCWFAWALRRAHHSLSYTYYVKRKSRRFSLTVAAFVLAVICVLCRRTKIVLSYGRRQGCTKCSSQ